MKHSNPYVQYYQQKGYTPQEVSRPSTNKNFPSKFNSYDEYLEELHQWLNEQ